MEKKIKTFGDIKVGDSLYVIKYGNDYAVPSLENIHVSKFEEEDDESVTITIKEKVPNSSEPAGQFKIEWVSKDLSAIYGIYTDFEEAKNGYKKMLNNEINSMKKTLEKINNRIELYNTILKSDLYD